MDLCFFCFIIVFTFTRCKCLLINERRRKKCLLHTSRSTHLYSVLKRMGEKMWGSVFFSLFSTILRLSILIALVFCNCLKINRSLLILPISFVRKKRKKRKLAMSDYLFFFLILIELLTSDEEKLYFFPLFIFLNPLHLLLNSLC